MSEILVASWRGRRGCTCGCPTNPVVNVNSKSVTASLVTSHTASQNPNNSHSYLLLEDILHL
eukprot:1950356-Pyramimonas_sp.AAC.1